MMMTHGTLRSLFEDFWKSKGHQEVPAIPLVPQNDPTTLFTGSGMQQLVPYLLGEPHPMGKKLYNIQPCFRSQDIEEIGDNRHTTFFEMMGNWSLGTYFKKEQLAWFWEFLTEVLKLPKEKLYVSVFAGTKDIPSDTESLAIWKSLGVSEDKIFKYGPEKNWWSRAGVPDAMPAGEPGGPDSEVFYEFTEVRHTKKYGRSCHPNCDCGRFLEIGNSVFMQYKKASDGSFQELPNKNVDFGGGLERILAAINDTPDIFKTDLYEKMIQAVEMASKKTYTDEENKDRMRVIADHLKGAAFMAEIGIEPGNKEQGYIMRRLIRRSVVKMMELGITPNNIVDPISRAVIQIYPMYFGKGSFETLKAVIGHETQSFGVTVNKGVQMLQGQSTYSGKVLFDLKQSYGFPIEVALELLHQWGKPIDAKKVTKEFQEEFEKHKERSRAASIGKFKGGLADHNEKTIKYHTATHLLHQALYDVLGNEIRQEGSNITAERLRFDFYARKKPSDSEIEKAGAIVNEKIKDAIPVSFVMMPKEKAMKIGARSFFREKYPDTVKVYYIGSTNSLQAAYSKEFCGGPHVTNTKDINKIEIYKFEKIGSNLYRIYAR